LLPTLLDKQYNSPRIFLLPDTQSCFTILVRHVIDALDSLTLHNSSCLRRLEPLHYPFQYSLECRYRCEVSTTCYFPFAQVPLTFRSQACKQTFFPQLHSSWLRHPVLSDNAVSPRLSRLA